MAMDRLDIGLRQARVLCQMPHRARLEFLAEGLPIILASAQGFVEASRKLNSSPREANILAGFSEEEAAKILILVDMVRCPPKLLSPRLGMIVGWFYDHLARLIYSQASLWRPTDVAQLREYVDEQRMAHYIDGFVGEFIMPNWSIYERESRLYADIEVFESGNAKWNSPTNPVNSLPTALGDALIIAEAMHAVGMFTLDGLRAASEVWGKVDFTDKEGVADARTLLEEHLKRLVSKGLVQSYATQDHVDLLYKRWQLPMYDFDLRPIHVPLNESKAEQDAIYWSEVGDHY